MQTTIGLFPKENGRFIDVIAKAAEEGLYDSILEPSEGRRNINRIPEAVSQNIGSIYEEIVTNGKDIDSLYGKSQRKHYNTHMWGEYYKRKEVNIVDNASEDEFVQTKAILSDTIMHSTAAEADRGNPLDDFENAEKLMDMQNVLKRMRELQKMFLYSERVDFRELLQNYFSEEPTAEGIEILETLIKDYKEKVKDTLGEYLIFRQDKLIPDKYKKTLF